MIRKLILALVILAVAAAPMLALAWDGRGGRHEFRGHHERFEHFHRPFSGFYSYPQPYYAYAPPACYWQEGYWGPNHPYIDQYGFERFTPAWVPAQYVATEARLNRRGLRRETPPA